MFQPIEGPFNIWNLRERHCELFTKQLSRKRAKSKNKIDRTNKLVVSLLLKKNNMSSISSKMVKGSLIIGACAIICVAIVVQAQYNTFDSDSNSDSDGNPILTQTELGKLVRNSAKAHQQQNRHNQLSAANTRNLYNRQQPLQYAPTHHRRNYNSDSFSGYGPSAAAAMGAASSSGRSGSNINNDGDDDGDSSSNFGPNFGANFDSNNDDGEGSGADGQGDNTGSLNQAASGYPTQGDYNNDAAGFGFGGSSGYGPSSSLDGSEFGPSEGFGGEGRRAKSASSPSSSRNYGLDDDAGAPQYGPNSAVNSGGDIDEDGRAGYSPDSQGDNDNDDE